MEKTPSFETNPLLAKLLASKAGDGIAVMGYVGPIESDDTVILYKSISARSKSFAIKLADIVHSVEAPATVLPFGGIIIWLKKDSEIVVRKSITADRPERGAYKQIRSGRLLIKIGRALQKGAGAHPPCVDSVPCSDGVPCIVQGGALKNPCVAYVGGNPCVADVGGNPCVTDVNPCVNG